MKKKHAIILREVAIICRRFGAKKDLTATHSHKLIYIQLAHKDVAQIIESIHYDHPENDQREYDSELLEIALNRLRWLYWAEFSDRSGKGLISHEFKEGCVYKKVE